MKLFLARDFHFSHQILFSVFAKEFGRALAEFRIVRQPIEGIPPQKIGADRVFLKVGYRRNLRELQFQGY
jgi:hypothetical protein